MWNSQSKARKLNINYRSTRKRMSDQPTGRSSRRLKNFEPELTYLPIKKDNPSFSILKKEVYLYWRTVCNVITKNEITLGINDKFVKGSINNCNMLFIAKVGTNIVGFITVYFNTYKTPMKPPPDNAICGEHEWYIDLICAKPGNGKNVLIGLMDAARKENEKNNHNITQFRAHTLEAKRKFFVKNGFVAKDNASDPNEKESEKYYQTHIGRIWEFVDVSEINADVSTIPKLRDDIDKIIKDWLEKERQKKEGPSSIPKVIDLNLEEPMSGIEKNQIYSLSTNQFIKPIIVDDIKQGLRMTLAIPR